MLGLFARFSDLYGELAKHKGLEIYREDKFGVLSSELTREFQLWCLKLNDIDMQGIARGVEALENQIIKNSSKGEKSWPPSYAEFKGLCVISAKKAAHKMHVALSPPILSDEEKAMRMKEIRMRFGL